MTRHRQIAGLAFLATIAIALVSPLEAASHRTLTAHMVQHVLLIAVAGPALAFTLPEKWMTASRWYAWTAAALVCQVVIVLAWHAPVAFDAALRHDQLHGLEHISMIAGATWFWWLLARTRPRRGEAVVALFLSTLPMTVLGVGLLLSKTPWYASYRDVTDQQVAGAVMWAVGGGIAVAQGVALFVVWLASVERTSVTPAEVGSA